MHTERVKIQTLGSRREQIRANAALLVTVGLWGVSFVNIKIAVSEVPPVTMALIRFAAASVILLAITRKLETAAKIRRKDMPKMVLAGVLGITLYFYFENTGVKLTTAANASLIVSIVPVIAIAMDKLFFRTKITAIQLAGMATAIIGTYLAVTANGQVNFNSATFRGNVLMLGAMLSWSLYTLVNKSFKGAYSGLLMTTYQTVLGTFFLIPLSFTEYHKWRLFSLASLGNILFLALFCSVVCYLLYMYALKNLDVAITTIYLNLVPVIGVVSGHFILGENVLPVQMLGGSFTILAILALNFEKYRKLPVK